MFRGTGSADSMWCVWVGCEYSCGWSKYTGVVGGVFVAQVGVGRWCVAVCGM